MWAFLKRQIRQAVASGERPVPDPWAENDVRIARLRGRGVRIGEGCTILTEEFSTEPYLVAIGDRVAVAGGTVFLTHDGSVRFLRRTRPNAQHLGCVVVGDDTYIGQNCILLPGTRIGARCILGAGSVVRGDIPENSLVVGNPARVVGRATIAIERMANSPDTLDTLDLPEVERRAILEKHFGIPSQ